jgi:hypothetical protein
MKHCAMFFVLALGIACANTSNASEANLGQPVNVRAAAAPASIFLGGCALIVVILTRPRKWHDSNLAK